MVNIPQSVPTHLASADRDFWTPAAPSFDWANLDLTKTYAISGSAFIDLSDPYGPMGNPFAVVIGGDAQITELTRTPETVFIRDCHKTNSGHYGLLLTVLTPTGKELGACAHGFTGAIQTLLSCGKLKPGSEVTVRTTLDTSAQVFVSDKGVIALEFKAQDSRTLRVASHTLQDIFKIELISQPTDLPVLSVGSPKLIVELSPEAFSALQQALDKLDYDKLFAFEDKEHINGIHLFCRDQTSKLPQKTIQVNAYLGRDNVIDPATGVSAAAQISADPNVDDDAVVTITQYTAKGPSATLTLARQANAVRVGGTAVLFNYRVLAS